MSRMERRAGGAGAGWWWDRDGIRSSISLDGDAGYIEAESVLLPIFTCTHSLSSLSYSTLYTYTQPQ